MVPRRRPPSRYSRAPLSRFALPADADPPAPPDPFYRPNWFRFKNIPHEIRYNAKRRNWRRTKLGI
jgi:hypothetical protein